MTARYVDAHCHAHEFEEGQIEKYGEMFEMIVAVSDDAQSSARTLELARKYRHLIPCVGIHPGSLKEVSDLEAQLNEVERLAASGEVRCLGEIGLDLAFVPETYDLQLQVFRRLLEIARDYDLSVNLHTAKAWRPALEEVLRYGIKRALFHWYTGPPDVLTEIVSRGFFISINPSIKISRKHREIAARAPLSSITFESDGPYEYRGLYLTPTMIPETITIVAADRGVEPAELIEISRDNVIRFLGGL